MTVRLVDGEPLRLEGDCPIEDAETLLAHMLASPGVTVDWRACEWAHTAVIQVLLASGAPLRGPPAGAFLRERIEPLLVRTTDGIMAFPKGGRMP